MAEHLVLRCDKCGKEIHQCGLAGLAKFRGKMELPPPVNNAEKLICEAAERLRPRTATEDPENCHTLDNDNCC